MTSDMDLGIPSDSEEEVPDWLKGLREDEGTIEPEPAGEESPDMQDMAEGDQDEALETPLNQDAGGENPDSMASGQIEDSQVEDSASDTQAAPDWLTNIRAAETENVSPEEQPSASESSAEEGEIPDWLNQVREREEERLGDEEISGQDNEDFMERIQSLESDKGAVEKEESDQESPDWLSGLQSETAPTEPDEGQTPDMPPEIVRESPSKTESDLLDILPSEEIIEQPDIEESLSEEELSALREDRDNAVEQVDSEFPDLPKESGFVDTGSLPSWLVDMKRTGSLNISDLPEEILASSEESDDLAAESEEEMPEFELSPGDLPDWISESSSDLEYPEEEDADIDIEPDAPTSPNESDAQTSPKESEVPISSADMPKWLYGMRPVESPYAPEEGEDVEETVGPLAGLQNIIPAEPEISQFGETPAYSYNIQVSEIQQHNASLFERLIAADYKPMKTKTRAAALTQGALRWAIAGLIFVSLLVPILSESNSIDFPDIKTNPVESQLFQGYVGNLEQGKPILVSFDYQPGLSGEMHAASAAVFDDLLLQGAQLVIISTQPTGPALAESFLALTQADKHLYVQNKEYRNLGYLAGGISGLLGLAQNPQQALPVNIVVTDQFQEERLQSLWETSPLDGIAKLSDFGMVLVLTDDPDIARAWVEQVKPSLGDTPLTMVLSAQAEPLVRPYFDSDPKQIQGYITGILGGAHYESFIGRDNVARTYWNSYSTGLGIAVFIIFFGSLATLVSSLLSRRKATTKVSR